MINCIFSHPSNERCKNKIRKRRYNPILFLSQQNSVQISSDLDDSYTSSDEYHAGEQGGLDKPRPNHSRHPFPAASPGSGQPELFVDFEDFVLKFNSIVRALVDAAKAVEKKAGEEKGKSSR